jgi:hypothetical protein
MRRLPARIVILACFSATLLFGWSASVLGQNREPTRVLKNRGLKRQHGKPSNWVLQGEEDLLQRARSLKAMAERLASVRGARQELAAGADDPRAFIAAFQTQIDMGEARISEIDRQLAGIGPSVGNVTVDNWHNLLVQERNSIVGDQRRLNGLINGVARQGGAFERQQRQFDEDVEGMAVAFRNKVDELQTAVDNVLKKYAKLAADEEISRALAELSRTQRSRQNLGPSRELQSVARWLEGDRNTSARKGGRVNPKARR